MADKIPLRLPYKHSLLLPPARTVFDIIGFPTELSGILRMNARGNKVQRPLPADPKTLRGESVSPRIARKIYRYIRREVGPISFSRLRDQWFEDLAPEDMTTENAAVWRNLVYGWQASPHANCDWLLQFPKTVAYVLALCAAEDDVATRVCRAEDDAEKAAIKFAASKDITLIDHDVLDGLFLALFPRMIEQGKSVELTEDEARALLWFGLDGLFRFAAVAEREFIDDCGTRYDMDKYESKIIDRYGVLDGMMPDISDGKFIFPYTRLFEGWRESASTFKNLESPMSWQKFAELFPDPILSDSRPGEADISASKKRQLHAWRQGRRPKDETIEAFIQGLYGQQSDVMWHIAWKNMAYGFSDYCNEILKDRSVQHLDIETLLVEACARYDDYFRWAKTRATNEEPPAAD